MQGAEEMYWITPPIPDGVFAVDITVRSICSPCVCVQRPPRHGAGVCPMTRSAWSDCVGIVPPYLHSDHTLSTRHRGMRDCTSSLIKKLIIVPSTLSRRRPTPICTRMPFHYFIARVLACSVEADV